MDCRRVDILLYVFCLALYYNTWSAEFAFDDNFAVLYNGDVTGTSPVLSIFRHDFWGQVITSDQSHKSYRPVTILVFRAIRFLGQFLPGGKQTGPNPCAFHVANTIMHAAASCLFFRVALAFTFALHSLPSNQENATRTTQGSRLPQANLPRLQACIAAFLFAAHPIHTEAVAGVVGHAELLSAALAFAALLAYMAAAKCMHNRQHLWQLLVAVALLFTATLAKEIGITMVAAMVLWDVFLLPWPSKGRRSLWQRTCQLAVSRKAQRLVAACCCVLAYAWLRSWLAGDHLVRIYRKVENPIPFANAWTAKLTTGYLHAKYFQLLIVPIWLSADWSYACIPYVHTIWDPRNAATAATYFAVMWVIACSRPLQTAAQHMLHGSVHNLRAPASNQQAVLIGLHDHSSNQQTRATSRPSANARTSRTKHHSLEAQATATESIWLMVVVLGLTLAPFLPAANILFYVGTFIGERLLYMPSAGFCLLLSLAAVKAIGSNGLQCLGQPLHSLGLVPSSPGLVPSSPGLAPSSPGLAPSSQAAGQSPNRLQHPEAAIATTGSAQQDKDWETSEALSSRHASDQTDQLYLQGGAARQANRPRGQHIKTQLHQQQHKLQQDKQQHEKQQQLDQQQGSMRVSPQSTVGLALLALLLVGYSWRTVTRNRDWRDEETLFIAAQQVCLNSAKVRLNSGILERRHSNWAKALHHFRSARQIDDTYCEPTYWIGATLLQEGKHLPQALQELEAAVSCKYVAANAVNALQQVYQVLGNASPAEKAGMQQAWARILVKPELRRASEACQVLEQSALDSLQDGGTFQQAQGILQPCLQHLEQEIALQTGSDPAANIQLPSSDLPLAVSYNSSSLQMISSCVKARLKVLKAMSGHQAGSQHVQRAARKYLGNHMPACRMQDSHSTEQAAVAAAHLQLVHQVQKANAEDPWFQQEWGEILIQQGRLQEATVHLQVAASLFTSHISKETWSKAGTAANHQELAEHAVRCLQQVRQEVPSSACSLLKQECEVYHTLYAVVAAASHKLQLQTCVQRYQTNCQHSA